MLGGGIGAAIIGRYRTNSTAARERPEGKRPVIDRDQAATSGVEDR